MFGIFLCLWVEFHMVKEVLMLLCISESVCDGVRDPDLASVS